MQCGLENGTVSPVRALVLHAFSFTDYTTSKTSCLLAPGLTSTYVFPPLPLSTPAIENSNIPIAVPLEPGPPLPTSS